MTRIEDLQVRITRALDRISEGVEAWSARPMPEAGSAAPPEPVSEPDASAPDAGQAAELASLREVLEDERLANAQLEERLRVLKGRLENETAGLREQVATQREGLADLDSELQRLRQVNEALRASSEALRAAGADSVRDPHLLNAAMLAELEALRAVRGSEAAELRIVYDALQPLLVEAGAGPGADAGQEERV